MTARGVPGPLRSDLGFPLMSSAAFSYAPLLPTGPDQTEYRLITDEGVDVVDGPGGRRFLTVDPAALTALTAEAMHDIAHYLRPAHLAQLRSIIDDPAASRRTTASSRWICCATPTSPPAACCRCARTPAPRS